MTGNAFLSILNARLDAIRTTLGAKSDEYATAGDRLYNFKRAAAVIGTTPAQALLGMWAKHAVSVMDLADGTRKPTLAVIDEKLGDAINYLILLEALLKEGLPT